MMASAVQLPGVIPLSIAFLLDDGTILNIEEMKPQRLDSHCSARPARFALEKGWPIVAAYNRAGDKIGKVGLGFQRPIKDADGFLGECFSRLDRGVRVHGFAMASERFTRIYPFASVDSATWIHELKALSAITGQASDVLQFLTQGELLKLVLLKYERLPMATAWAGRAQGGLFGDIE